MTQIKWTEKMRENKAHFLNSLSESERTIDVLDSSKLIKIYICGYEKLLYTILQTYATNPTDAKKATKKPSAVTSTKKNIKEMVDAVESIPDDNKSDTSSKPVRRSSRRPFAASINDNN
jgi:hypothetical protein